jgi:hypothetical protein
MVALQYSIPFPVLTLLQLGTRQLIVLFSWKAMVVSHGALLMVPKAELDVILPLFSVSARDVEPAFFLSHFASLLNLIPNLTRLSLATIFVVSFFLKPLQRPIMTLWERVIESDMRWTPTVRQPEPLFKV